MFLGEGQNLMKILLSTGIICDLINVNLQSQTYWILKTKYYFLDFRQFEILKNLVINFYKLAMFEINLTEIIINYKKFYKFLGILKQFFKQM